MTLYGQYYCKINESPWPFIGGDEDITDTEVMETEED